MKRPSLTPARCRWNPDSPPPFTIWLNILYAIAGGIASSSLSYSLPILHVLADDFKTSQVGIASIPTLAQAGDATGLLLILPLADFFPRRRFVILLLGLSMAFWIGLCITDNLSIFMALTYLSAVFTGVHQVMLPLVAELSTPDKRAFNISITGQGPTMGILLARILSGIVANYTSWRNVYWMALGLQGSVLIALWLFMPDYPSTNVISKRELAKKYPAILWSIITLYPRYPVLVQASLLSFCTFFTVSSYWTTLTFLLSEAPYHYNTFWIGLFGLIGAATMVLGPLYGKYIIQPIGSPLISALIGKMVSLVGIVVGTFAGRYNVAGPVIQALLLDAGLMILQISNRVAIHDIQPKARNRVNTAFVSMLYLGSLSGTKAGNEVYEKYGGWTTSGCLSIAMIGISLVFISMRGPHESGWIGWSGGWRSRKAGEKTDIEAEPDKRCDSEIEKGASEVNKEQDAKEEVRIGVENQKV